MVSPRAWSHGEVSPSLQKRIDLDSYARSAKTLRNWKVIREGGIETRPGTVLSAPVKYSADETKNVVVREFIFNNDAANTYAIEIGHEYMRFHKNREQIREDAQDITAISQAVPGVVTYTGADPSNGDELYLSGIYGMTELNGRWVKVANVNTGANTFELQAKDGTNINTTGFTTYASGGTFEPVFEVETDYQNEDIYNLSLTQFNDVVVIACAGYAPAKLTRSADTSWTLVDIFTRADYDIRILNLAGTTGVSGTTTQKYKVSYIPIATGKETLPGTEAAQTVTGITNASPPVVSVTAHGYSDGDTVVFNGIEGMDEVNGREFIISVASAFVPDAPIAITGITLANPMVVTTIAAHGFSVGDKISFNITSGTTELNAIEYATISATPAADTFRAYYFGTTTQIDSRVFTAFTSGTVIRHSPNPTATNSFELRGVDSSDWGTFSASITPVVARTTLYLNNAGTPTSANPHVLEWTIGSTQGVVGGVEETVSQYVIYKETNGVFGFLGTSKNQTFNDVGATPDTSDGPRAYSELFFEADDYPYVCGFGKQRLWFGGSNNNPNRVIGSVAGDYFNFYTRDPQVSSDRIIVDLVSNKANVLRSIKEVAGRVIAFTSEGEFGVGDTDGVIDANQPDAQHFTSHGSTTVRPLLINDIATFIQARSSQVRDLGFNFESNAYKGDERSIRSTHLFKGYTILDWCHQQVPDSIIWAVRSDGKLLGCTFVREEQMTAWHRHDMVDGEVKSVCCIPGSEQDDVYMVVQRTLDDQVNITVEVFDNRLIVDGDDDSHNVRELAFTDGTVSYDGRHSDGVQQVRLKDGTTYAAGESLTLEGNTADMFTSRGSENVGNSIFLHLTEDEHGEEDLIKCEILSFDSGTELTVRADKDIPAGAQVVYFTLWDYAQPYITGLHELEGHTVSAMGDGYIITSAMNDEYGAALTVENGRADFSQPFAVIRAGKPFVCDFVPLDIDSVQAPGGGLINQQKIVNKIYIALETSRGLYIGQDAPSDDDDDPLEDLEPLQRTDLDANYDDPVELVTDTLTNDTIAAWNSRGSCFIRQIDPIPARILAILLEGQTYI